MCDRLQDVFLYFRYLVENLAEVDSRKYLAFYRFDDLQQNMIRSRTGFQILVVSSYTMCIYHPTRWSGLELEFILFADKSLGVRKLLSLSRAVT